jgi:hypothetical protein
LPRQRAFISFRALSWLSGRHGDAIKDRFNDEIEKVLEVSARQTAQKSPAETQAQTQIAFPRGGEIASFRTTHCQACADSQTAATGAPAIGFATETTAAAIRS